MATWMTMQRHLRLVIALYVLTFCGIMYQWQSSWSQQLDHSRSLSFLQTIGANRPHADVMASSHHGDPALALDLRIRADPPTQPPPPPQSGQTLKNDVYQRLVVTAEALDGGSGNGSRDGVEVGVRKGARGADHTLNSRLTSAFRGDLDCPRTLPLTFLGMNWTSVDLGQDPACAWIEASVRNPEQNFVALGGEMAVLSGVTLDPGKLLGARGGERIKSVFKQKEDVEYFNVQRGFFSLPCRAPPEGVKFHVNKRNYRRFNHLNQWLSALVCSNHTAATTRTKAHTPEGGQRRRSSSVLDLSRGYVPGVTIALERYEYANVYHTMLDWYNVFISILVLGVDPNFATFLLVDGHPWGKLDATWANLFGGRGVLRAGHLPGMTTFEHVVWVPNGNHCPLFDTDRDNVPFLPQLREYFFRSYGVEPNPGPQCRQLRMLLVRRRDYLAHPRNPSGVVDRKMDNENEVTDALTTAFPQHQVTVEQLDLLTMRRQLEILSRVDILVGMHGAALTYTILLPEGAALVELYPKYAHKTSMVYKQISKWRGVHYVQWMNQDPRNEKPNKFTYIPTPVVVDLVRQVIAKMCTGG